jgi:biopolymer transport protein ExbB
LLSSIQRLVDLGGPVVVILLALSVLGLAIIVYKVVQLRRFSRTRFVECEARCGPDGGSAPAARAGSVLDELVDFASSEVARQQSRDVVEAELTRRGTRIVGECSRYLRALEVIAYLSPLLGLLGTVLGMIDAFRGLEFERGAGEAGSLAGGIWEALLTTALGLGIAIPMTAAHALFEAQVQGIAERLEDLLQRIVAG